MSADTPSDYGMMVQFETSRDLLNAAQQARNSGYCDIDAYSPFPVEGLAQAVGYNHNRIALITLIFGIVGGLGAYFLQWYTAVIDYPFNSGGRPYHSWPPFVVIALELSILGAALGAFFGMLLMNGLPRLRHPVFNAKIFDLGSGDKFFLCIRATDPRYDKDEVRKFLSAFEPLSLTEITTD